MIDLAATALRPKLWDLKGKYTKQNFINDILSGIIVGIVAFPLSLAFGIASGVTPEVGLITAIIGGFIVSFLGGSKVQIGGPTGAFIVIVYSIIQQYGIDGLIVASFIAGILLIIMALLKLGSLIKFIPYPIVVGFTAGIAITIFSTQINDLLDLGVEKVPGDFIDKWEVYINNITHINWLPLTLGIGTILIISLTSKITKKLPGSLIAIIIITLISAILKQYGIYTGQTIGDKFSINAAIPMPHLPNINLELIRSLFPSAFTIALLGAIESLLSASVADGIIGDKHRSDAELMAQGVANMVVPFFGGIPVTGAIARTMTNINNGGRSPIAGMVHAFVLLLIFLFFTPLMNYIPMSCLAGILIVVAYNMFGWRSVLQICKTSKEGAIVMGVTFLLTVLLDLTVAIEVGILISMLIFTKRVMESTNIIISKNSLHIAREDDVIDTAEEDLILPKGVEVYEINGPYFFGIANKFEEAMIMTADKPKVRIIRMRKVSFMDSTAMHNLYSLVRMNLNSNVNVVLSGVSTNLRQTLHEGGIDNLVGEENICSHIHLAIERSKQLIMNQ